MIGGNYKTGSGAICCHRPLLHPLLLPSTRFTSCKPLQPSRERQVATSQSSPTYIMARRQSLESVQSFELLSPPSGSHVSAFTSSDDDDEIVWSVASLSLSDRALFSPRSEDYVVLSPPSVTSSSYAADVQLFIEDDLISNPPIFSQPSTPQPSSPPLRSSRRNRNCNAHAQQQPTRGQASPIPSKPSDKKPPASSPSPKRRRRRSEKRTDTSPPRGKSQNLIVAPLTPRNPTKGLGARSVVDDISERGDDNDSIYGGGRSELSSAVYDKAVHYINRYVAVHPVLPPEGEGRYCLT